MSVKSLLENEPMAHWPTGMKHLIFFVDKEETCPSRRGGRMNDASSERRVNVLFHRFPLWGRQRVKVTSRGKSTWEHINGAVIGSMRRQRGSPGLTENLLEVKGTGRNSGEIPGVGVQCCQKMWAGRNFVEHWRLRKQRRSRVQRSGRLRHRDWRRAGERASLAPTCYLHKGPVRARVMLS